MTKLKYIKSFNDKIEIFQIIDDTTIEGLKQHFCYLKRRDYDQFFSGDRDVHPPLQHSFPNLTIMSPITKTLH